MLPESLLRNMLHVRYFRVGASFHIMEPKHSPLQRGEASIDDLFHHFQATPLFLHLSGIIGAAFGGLVDIHIANSTMASVAKTVDAGVSHGSGSQRVGIGANIQRIGVCPKADKRILQGIFRIIGVGKQTPCHLRQSQTACSKRTYQ